MDQKTNSYTPPKSVRVEQQIMQKSFTPPKQIRPNPNPPDNNKK